MTQLEWIVELIWSSRREFSLIYTPENEHILAAIRDKEADLWLYFDKDENLKPNDR